MCLVPKPLNRSVAKGDLLFKCELLCNYAHSLQIKGLATKYTTVKWPIRRACMKGSCLINIQSIDLHIIKRFLLCSTSNFNMKHLDIICYFQKLGSTFLIFKFVYL